MNMIRSAVAGFVMLMGCVSFAAETPYGTDREGRPMLVEHVPMPRFAELVEGDAGGGLRWMVCVTPEGTQHDPIAFQFAVLNGTQKRIRFGLGGAWDIRGSMDDEGEDDSGRKVTLRLEKIENGAKVLAWTVVRSGPRAVALLSDGANLKPGEIWGSGQIDVREYFGHIQPGTYRIRIETDGIARSNRSSISIFTQTLASPWVSFEIIETSIAEALAEMSLGENDLLFEAKRSDGEGYQWWTATLGVPRSSEAMTVTADFGFRNPEEREGPASVLSCIERFNPKRGWVAEPCGWCGTGMGPLTIEPGTACAINLGAAFQSSGIYRFAIPTRTGEDAGRFVSLPFVVEK